MPNQYKARLAMLGMTQTAILPMSRCESVRLIPDPPEKGAAVCGI